MNAETLLLLESQLARAHDVEFTVARGHDYPKKDRARARKRLVKIERILNRIDARRARRAA